MALLEWFTLVSSLFPKNFSSLFVERVDDPTVLRAIFGSIAITVKAGTKRSLGITTDCAGYEDAISPNDRARVGQTRNRCTPKNVLSCFCIPLVRKILTFGDA